jgi:hypothetical protein
MTMNVTDPDPRQAEAYDDWCRARGLVGQSPAAHRHDAVLNYERLIERTRVRAKHAATERDREKIAAKLDHLDTQHTLAWREVHEPPFSDLHLTEHECGRCGRSLGAGREGRRAAYNNAGRCEPCFHGTEPAPY